jgi:dihydrofolate synthase/folylpolyglutamate synthase
MGSDAILSRLLDLHPKKIDLSLERIERLLAALGNPERRLAPVIHVAGTNGKGSTIAFLRAMLEADGRRVHVYTSPHLVRFHERIRLGAPGGGRLVDEELLAATLARCESANAGAPITFFEITTAAAFLLFAEHPADIVLLEVGLGGRVDATNVIGRPLASVITPISVDHVEFLGPDIASIAFEKAGIIKPGAPLISAPQPAEARDVLARQAARLKAPAQFGNEDFHAHEEGGRLVYEDGAGLLDLPLPRLPGRHQHENAATAIATLRRALPRLPERAIERGLVEARWPARLQRLSQGVLSLIGPSGAEVWLDGGHNSGGGRALAEAMAEMEDQQPRPLALVCGTLANKDTRGFLSHFVGLAAEVLAVPIGGEHAGRPPQEVAEAARSLGIPAAAQPGLEAAFGALASRKWRVAPRILICGSLYLAGEALARDGALVD